MSDGGVGPRSSEPHVEGWVPLLDVGGRLGRKDRQRWRVFDLDLPERATRLRVDFRYEPGEVSGVRNLITISIFDARGFRGAAHRWSPAQQVTIAPDEATPGFLPGPLHPGRWRIELDAHEVVDDGSPGGSCRIRLRAMADLDPAATGNRLALDARDRPHRPHRVNGVAGWYRGDLHSHSVHCDGSSTILEMAGAAADRGLDFLAATGHNTTSPWLVAEPWPDGLLRIRGVEWTTFFGHANVLGVRDWIDWRVESPADGARSMLAEAARQDAFTVVNHPCADGNPVCTGCRWDYPDDDLQSFDAIEVWNSAWLSRGVGNEAALGLWTRLLMEGHRLTAVAGTDAHKAAEYEHGDLPYTWVRAAALGEHEILSALRAGRACLTTGPRLAFAARDRRGGLAAVPGDRLSAGRFDISVLVTDLPAPAILWLVSDGTSRVLGRVPVQGATVQAEASADRWWRLELRTDDADASMLAVTNPVLHGQP